MYGGREWIVGGCHPQTPARGEECLSGASPPTPPWGGKIWGFAPNPTKGRCPFEPLEGRELGVSPLRPHQLFGKSWIKNLIKCQGRCPRHPRLGEGRMGLRPKPHKLFEKSLTKNLIKCQGRCPRHPRLGERYGALPQTPRAF